MAYAHIAHDCMVGNGAILANGTTLGGHVRIDDDAVIGAFTGIHQFCRVGKHSIIGGYSVITKDVLPFSMTVSERDVRLFGINKVGLERHGFSAERRNALSRAFRLLLSEKLNTSQALEQIRAQDPTEDVEELLRFIEGSERGVIK
jgi:UDP-N-acetylglucosamine acyltransferase